MTTGPVTELFQKIIHGDRVALGRGMTLLESQLASDRALAIELLTQSEQYLSSKKPALRLAISGAPGVGKSTLIEALGMHGVSAGHTIGVITIDPSSSVSAGSILGDKSRMNNLSRHHKAFVRPSAAGDVLGGLGRRSMELMTLMEAAGYDYIFVETVGVGQSEHTAWKLTDGFILVIQPGAGDELQGIKRGITELADIVIVNKADGDLKALAKMAKSQYESAIHLFSSTRDYWTPKVLTCSAIDGKGIDEIWETFRSYRGKLDEGSRHAAMRTQQKQAWLEWSIGLTTFRLAMENPLVKGKIAKATGPGQESPVSVFATEFEIENIIYQLLSSADIESDKNT